MLLDKGSLNEDKDNLVWKLTACGQFITKSLCDKINCVGEKKMMISSKWDCKIPSNIRGFCWLVLGTSKRKY